MEQKHSDKSSLGMISENEIDEKIVLRGIWDISSMKRVDQIPFSIDETKYFEIVGKNRSDVLHKLGDGCPWKRDTRSNWTGYKSFRYQDCRGCFFCPNVNCVFFLQFDEPVRVNFDKAGKCMIFSTIEGFQKRLKAKVGCNFTR